MVDIHLFLKNYLQLLVICFFNVVGTVTYIYRQLPSSFEVLHNWLRLGLFGEVFEQLGGDAFVDLFSIEVVFVLEKVPILVKEETTVFTLFDQILSIIFINRYSFILQISDQFFGMASILRKKEELDNVFKLRADIEWFLRELLANFGQNTVFICSKLEEKLQSSNFELFIGNMLLFVANLMQHLVVDLFQLFEHFVEGGPLLRIIGQHIVCEKLPIGV